MGVGGQHQDPAALPRERDPVPLVQEAEWAPENLVLREIRSPDRPNRSQSLYTLSYPGLPW